MLRNRKLRPIGMFVIPLCTPVEHATGPPEKTQRSANEPSRALSCGDHPAAMELFEPRAMTHLTISRQELQLLLTRITDRQMQEEFQGSIQLNPDYLFWMLWHCRELGSGESRIGLAGSYFALQNLFGDSSSRFDPCESSFSYPFRMTTRKGQHAGIYLVRIGDWKGGVEVQVFRPVGLDGPARRPDGFLDFIEDEFSRSDFHYLVSFLFGYLEGYLESLQSSIGSKDDFATWVDYENIVYGCEHGRLFERQFESSYEFDRERRRQRERTRRRAP